MQTETVFFVDAEFHPYPEQWGFLASIKGMSAAAVEGLVLEAQRCGDIVGVKFSTAEDDARDPWTLPPSQKRAERPIPGPCPSQVQIVRANLVYIEKRGLPSAMLNRLLRLAAFQNPEFYTPGDVGFPHSISL